MPLCPPAPSPIGHLGPRSMPPSPGLPSPPCSLPWQLSPPGPGSAQPWPDSPRLNSSACQAAPVGGGDGHEEILRGIHTVSFKMWRDTREPLHYLRLLWLGFWPVTHSELGQVGPQRTESPSRRCLVHVSSSVPGVGSSLGPAHAGTQGT